MKKNCRNIFFAAAFTAAAVTTGSLAINSYKSIDETAPAVTEEGTEETIVSSEKQLPKLSEIEYRLIELLYNKMYDSDLKGAATLINENQYQLQKLYYDCLEGQDYLFDGESLKINLDGKGIVLKSPSTVFYGYFENGYPEGVATALKAIVLDTPRYDYSVGTWKEGLLNGQGEIGYDCYGGTEEDEKPKIRKEGIFQDDLMDGNIIYQTVNSGGVTNTWEISVKQGVTLVTNKWDYHEETNDYRLPSKNNENHVYILKAEEINTVRWMNMVKWPK